MVKSGTSLIFSPGRYTCGMIGLDAQTNPKETGKEKQPQNDQPPEPPSERHTRRFGFSLTIRILHQIFSDLLVNFQSVQLLPERSRAKNIHEHRERHANNEQDR
ncbi:MAG: hypothetical protein M0C28_28500 [Candidatus Moduliflexus flocculans]|nr:hypothetical protein [Candidatus Moduliflexus flocculans]